MIPAFAASFAKVQAAGLAVIVTMSGSAPFSCDTPQDAVDLVKAWVQDSNIDILSPKLYSVGNETKPEFDETSSCLSAGCTWKLYEKCKPTFAPVIVTATHYEAAKEYFDKNNKINTGGFIQWAQTHHESA